MIKSLIDKKRKTYSYRTYYFSSFSLVNFWDALEKWRILCQPRLEIAISSSKIAVDQSSLYQIYIILKNK